MIGWLIFGLAVIVLIVLTGSAFQTVRVSDWEEGAVYIDGGFDRMLSPGRHRIWRLGRRVDVVRISSAPTHVPVGPVDALTADRLPIRLNATVVYRIVDAKASLSTPVYPEIHLALSQALLAFAAGQTLEQLMSREGAVGDALASEMASQVRNAEILRVALSAIVLPPELRRMSTEVERARQDGLATLERARSEHASLRTLANAARMLKDNPELLNLRLLQAVGAGGKGATLVLGEGALKSGVERG
ncbi:MAG: hypothetical protein EON90_09060 [Brevundimonas sp.]|nr:MAG: hypothetical protein EON90_09060 [Brevundimonas sp.]